MTETEGWRRIAASVESERAMDAKQLAFYAAGVRDGWRGRKWMQRVARNVRAMQALIIFLACFGVSCVAVHVNAAAAYERQTNTLERAMTRLHYAISRDDLDNAATAVWRHVAKAIAELEHAEARGSNGAAGALRKTRELLDGTTAPHLRDAGSTAGR